jgi:hypothetical protein
MTQTYRELVIGGILVAPFVSYAAISIFIFMLLRPFLHIVRFSALFSNPPIAEFSLFITILGLVVALF